MLTPRELATVLAALRYWQNDLAESGEIFDGSGHFAEHAPLDAIEIDELCERLNSVDS